MPAPSFPAYARLVRKDFGHDRPSALQRTPTDLGLAKQTKVRSRVLVARAMNIELASLADYNSFIAWFQTDIDYGATWFDWTDPVDGATKSARIVDGTLKDVQIGGALANWIVGFTLETWSA